MEVIQGEAGKHCEVIFGAVTDESIEGRFQVTVIATGLDEEQTANRAVEIPSQGLDQIEDPNSQISEDDSLPVASGNGRE